LREPQFSQVSDTCTGYNQMGLLGPGIEKWRKFSCTHVNNRNKRWSCPGWHHRVFLDVLEIMLYPWRRSRMQLNQTALHYTGKFLRINCYSRIAVYAYAHVVPTHQIISLWERVLQSINRLVALLPPYLRYSSYSSTILDNQWFSRTCLAACRMYFYAMADNSVQISCINQYLIAFETDNKYHKQFQWRSFFKERYGIPSTHNA